MDYQNALSSLKHSIDILVKDEIKNQKFLVATLAKKANSLANEFSYDPTVIGMRDFLFKRAQKEDWISRQELQKVYSHLEKAGNKFKDYFSAELALASPQILKPTLAHSISPDASNDISINRIVDPTIREAMSQLFADSKVKNIEIDKNLSKLALSLCEKTLKSYSPQPKSLQAVAGNSQAILCQASYETPKGLSYLIVPVEVENGNMKFPNRFFSVDGLIELSASNLQNSIVKQAGAKLPVSPQVLLNNFAPMAESQEFDSITLAVAQMKLEKQAKEQYQGSQVLNFAKPESIKESKIPSEIQEEMKNFAEFFNNNKNLAKIDFGNLADKAQNLVEYKLNSLGFDHYKVSIANSDLNGITFNVKLTPKLAFTVPVKINKTANQIIEPKIIIASGQIEEFSLNGINAFNQINPDLKALEYDHEDSPIQILSQIEESLFQNQFEKAASLLQVLRETKDARSTQAGIALYQKALKDGGQSLRKSSEISQCKLQIKSASHQFPICGHTNLPLTEVSQDKLGNCIPKYRKYLDQTDMSGSKLISHQICWS